MKHTAPVMLVEDIDQSRIVITNDAAIKKRNGSNPHSNEMQSPRESLKEVKELSDESRSNSEGKKVKATLKAPKAK